MTTVRSITSRPISGALGAEVRGIDLATIDEEGFAELLELLRAHLVVFLPDQHLSPDAHRELGRRFGEIEIHPFIAKLDEAHPEIVLLESDRGMIADVWHTDVTFSDSPPKFSILNVLKAPPVGGDTMWSNQHLVFESLSAPMQELLLGLTALHTAEVFGQPDVTAEHPVVRRHPDTGRPSLFVNRQFTKRILELSAGESDALLRHLWDVSEQPQFNCRYSWTEGTIGIWDNRATQHYVVNDFDGPRAISRVTVVGDDPRPAGEVGRWERFAPRRFSASAAVYSRT